MKKMFIDDISKRGSTASPGPGKYRSNRTFGNRGLSFSMARKLEVEKCSLGRSAKLPGPGHYKFIEVVGKDTSMSNYKTESKFSFGKANDRFFVPTRKVQSPAPGTYAPLNNLNQNYNSTFK